MSTTTSPSDWYEQESVDWYECDHCGEYSPSHTFFDTAMCSEECRRAADANAILNTLIHDHTVCSTCFRRLKEVEKPPERAPSAVVGFQYRTEHADWGEKQLAKFDNSDELNLPSLNQQVYAYDVLDEDAGELREYYPGRKYDRANKPEETPSANEPVQRTTICDVCGNTEHNSPDPDLRSNCSTMLVGHYLTERIRESDKSIDEVQFWDTYTDADATIHDALEEAVL